MGTNSQQIIDLDALIPSDKKASLGGVTYTVPGDMPLETFLRMQRVAQAEEAGGEEGDLIDQLKQAMFDLFSWKLAGENLDTPARKALQHTLDNLGIKTFMGIFRELYTDESEEVDEDPTPTPSQE